MVRRQDIKDAGYELLPKKEYPTLNTSVTLGPHHEAKTRRRSVHEINSVKEQLIRSINASKKL